MAGNDRDDLMSTTRTICDIIRSSLGPFGASKIVLTDQGNVLTVSSADTILAGLQVEDPTVELLASAVEGVAGRHGDGTTTLVALTGALLAEADRLVEEGIHPTTIENGYQTARETVNEYINRHGHPLSSVGVAAVARTALTGTRDPMMRTALGDSIAQAVEPVDARCEESGPADTDRVAVTTRVGPPSESRVVRGLVLEYSRVTDSMRRSAEGAGVAVLSSTVGTPTIAGEAARSDRPVSLSVESFEDRWSFHEHERGEFQEQLETVVDAGCRFIATSRAVSDRVKRRLANSGIIAIQRVDEADVRRLTRATGAVVCPSLEHVTPETLGRADVDTRRFAGRDMLVVENGAGKPVYTFLCRAPDPRSVNSIGRSVEAALSSSLRAKREGVVVPGGGAVELGASRVVSERARSIDSREQLAVEAFADALTAVPRTLAETAGMDEWKTIAALLSAHSSGRDATGIDVLAGDIENVLDLETPIVDAAGLKRDVVTAATELAIRIQRIDDRLPASEIETKDEAGSKMEEKA